MSEEHQDSPICPYCGHSKLNAWEINFGEGAEGDTTVICCDCGKAYWASRHCTVTYTTGEIKTE